MSSEAAKNPTGGAGSRHVMERYSLNLVTVAQVLGRDNLHGRIRLYIRGWMNYFGIGMKYTDAVALDHWLRRRIRM
jgi:hypothetical protein